MLSEDPRCGVLGLAKIKLVREGSGRRCDESLKGSIWPDRYKW